MIKQLNEKIAQLQNQLKNTAHERESLHLQMFSENNVCVVVFCFWCSFILPNAIISRHQKEVNHQTGMT